ncbi:hypothetical protein HELRODRAFT_160371 [Helobdella robusta]|uniref:Uncharacterized protein n=1 Tax=Helobdella robusta TaxID=6412 RepID=T1EQ56_HELRO|nr:hypothetical protein HELRODRAFT_160371 [Helobdella robusta]ESO06213.1 hypothetical protein HELRODRAFT_160371 [Helobdella robusta]
MLLSQTIKLIILFNLAPMLKFLKPQCFYVFPCQPAYFLVYYIRMCVYVYIHLAELVNIMNRKMKYDLPHCSQTWLKFPLNQITGNETSFSWLKDGSFMAVCSEPADIIMIVMSDKDIEIKWFKKSANNSWIFTCLKEMNVVFPNEEHFIELVLQYEEQEIFSSPDVDTVKVKCSIDVSTQNIPSIKCLNCQKETIYDLTAKTKFEEYKPQKNYSEKNYSDYNTFKTREPNSTNDMSSPKLTTELVAPKNATSSPDQPVLKLMSDNKEVIEEAAKKEQEPKIADKKNEVKNKEAESGNKKQEREETEKDKKAEEKSIKSEESKAADLDIPAKRESMTRAATEDNFSSSQSPPRQRPVVSTLSDPRQPSAGSPQRNIVSAFPYSQLQPPRPGYPYGQPRPIPSGYPYGSPRRLPPGQPHRAPRFLPPGQPHDSSRPPFSGYRYGSAQTPLPGQPFGPPLSSQAYGPYGSLRSTSTEFLYGSRRPPPPGPSRFFSADQLYGPSNNYPFDNAYRSSRPPFPNQPQGPLRLPPPRQSYGSPRTFPPGQPYERLRASPDQLRGAPRQSPFYPSNSS